MPSTVCFLFPFVQSQSTTCTMAALRPRITRIAGSNVQQARQLHMTGPSTFPTPLISSERSAIKGIPRDLMSLRAECKSKNLPTTGSKAEVSKFRRAACLGSHGFMHWLSKHTPRARHRSQTRAIPSNRQLTLRIMTRILRVSVAHCSSHRCGGHACPHQLRSSLQHLPLYEGSQ